MDFEDIFLLCDELKSIEDEISKLSNLLDDNPEDCNLQNHLSKLICDKDELSKKIEISKEELFLCDSKEFLKDNKFQLDLNDIITQDLKQHIGKQYIFVLLDNVEFKQKERLWRELLFISSNVSSLKNDLLIYCEDNCLHSNIFLNYMDELVKLDLVDINVKDNESYRLTDFGKGFISSDWNLNGELIKKAYLLFGDLSEKVSI